jgi:C1A family cysteine protease
MMMQGGTGWIPDPRGPVDTTAASPAIRASLDLFKPALPDAVNLQTGFPPVYDQGSTNSCTANALAGLIDYFEMKASGVYVAPSRMFIYKATRNFLQTESTDSGAYLRTALEAVALLGAAPESYWPFEPSLLAAEPPAFIYSMARNYTPSQYYRYDPDGVEKDAVLERIKTNLAIGIPSAFGFYLFESIVSGHATGKIPFPGDDEKGIGGHAVVAVGYDDAMEIENGASKTVGALRIRNSWGPSWGEDGYGWLPYEYVLKSLAIDWWSLFKVEWFDLDQGIFKIPAAAAAPAPSPKKPK